MGIYIKGMKMPKSCYKCTVRYACDAYFRYKDEHPYAIRSDGRLEDCPLVEIPKHGRLIDADMAYQETMRFGNHFREIVLKTIDILPTIIESEVEE